MSRTYGALCELATKHHIVMTESLRELIREVEQEAETAVAESHQNTVNNLIKMRDGWRDEAELLRKRLTQAELDNDLLRKHAARDAWFFQADGGDHIESMGRHMVVVIHAGDLQALLRAREPQYQYSGDGMPPPVLNDPNITLYKPQTEPGLNEANAIIAKYFANDPANAVRAQDAIAEILTRASAATVAEPSVEAWKNERCYYGVCDEEETHDARCTAWKEAAQQQAEPGADERVRHYIGGRFVRHVTTPAGMQLRFEPEGDITHVIVEAAQSGQRAGVAERVLDWLRANALPNYQIVVETNKEAASLYRRDVITVACSSWESLIEHALAAPTQQQEGAA